ncbi:MAG: HlyD family efflux transporter periplasmic adaptor subunit [Crocosphaera sp.]|nr:HlyD family efflux transporter periplasmic adaptor subunit [Crocosphaera sp.]
MPNAIHNGHNLTQSQEQQPLPPVVKKNIHHGDDWANSTKELLDAVPLVWTRGLVYFLVIFVGIVLPWAMLAKVDETGTATGKLEPQGKTVKLDAPVEGKVSFIGVQEGDTVVAGQQLMEIESDLIQVDLKQEKNKLEGQEARLKQLQILKQQLQFVFQTRQQQNHAQTQEKLAQVNQAKQNLDNLTTSFHLQKEEKQAQVDQIKQDLQHKQEAIKLAKIQLENAQEVKDRYDSAVAEGIVSEIQVVEKEDALQERKKVYQQSQSDIEQTKYYLAEQKSNYKHTIQQAKSEINQAELKLKEQENSYNALMESNQLTLLETKEQINNLNAEIMILQSDIKQTKSQIESLNYQLTQRVVKSPITGTIFELPIETEGAVVQPGNRILEIAPKNTALILKAQIATSESGSVAVGMPVKMKFDAYPFQDYGVVDGKLIEVSPTTTEIETSDGTTLVYDLEIELSQSCMPTSNECIKLRPGDTATAEVIIRQRRLIDFVLDPFKKLQNDGLKL